MKSIVLCERTLVKENEDFHNLKEDKINEDGGEKTKEKKILNGTSDGKHSETHLSSPESNGTYQNGKKRSLRESLEDEVEENKKRSDSLVESNNVANAHSLTDDTDSLTELEKNNSNSDKSETNCSAVEILSEESEIVEILDAQNSSSQSSTFKNKMDCTVDELNEDDCSEMNEEAKVFEKEKLESSMETERNQLKRNFGTADIEEELLDVKGKKNSQLLENISLDGDENKENEKEDKTNALEIFSGNDLLTKDSSECEIKVGDIQSISGLGKDSIWSENSFKKSEQDISEEKNEDDCVDISLSNEESMHTIDSEKEEENQDLYSDGNVVSDVEENVEEEMHIELGESEPTEELKFEEKERELSDLENFPEKKDTNNDEVEEDNSNYLKTRNGKVGRKRVIQENDGEDQCVKKKRLSVNSEEINPVQSDEENMEDSSRCENLASLDNMSASSKVATKKRTSSTENDLKHIKSSDASEEAQTKVQTSEAMFSVLKNFRGTLKTLTRSDLEELIIQKLCEVITERSNVGELRRRAQALEQDQERWKAKAQSLTKQMREMEMVMKKYISEVQKQIKEGDTHVVTPLKVTRSVGLQVSFYSSANKGPKPNMPQPNSLSSPQNVNLRNIKGPPPKSTPQFSPITQNIKNKPVPFQKGSPLLQKSVGQQRRQIVPRPDYGSGFSNRQMSQQSLLNNARGVQNQIPRSNYKPVTGMLPQQQVQHSHHSQQPQQQHQHQQQQPQQQQQQNGSKVIDLTDDDDRQTGNIAKTSGPIRVVNHLTQTPASQNNRFAYLLPTTSASTGPSVGQSRQVLIATPTMPQPNRQIMCSMPPLLFKGGNVVQSGCQPQMINQSNKVILPKAIRHPAPLPHRPINQSTRPSLKLLPPRPALKISKVQTGIVLSWNMSLSPEHAPIASYQLYAYQESDSPPATSLWKKVGDVKALPLPMACTLTQFMSGHKYHFAVRAVDLHSRIGPFSFPGTIVLV